MNYQPCRKTIHYFKWLSGAKYAVCQCEKMGKCLICRRIIPIQDGKLPEHDCKKEQQEEVKLKPCPFCGGTAIRADEFGNSEFPTWFISHGIKCYFSPTTTIAVGSNLEKMWNSRPDTEKVNETVAEIETLLDFGEWDKAKEKIRGLAERARPDTGTEAVEILRKVEEEEPTVKELVDWLISEWVETGADWIGCYHCEQRYKGTKDPKRVIHLNDCLVERAKKIQQRLTKGKD